jgi:protein O-mannosyl-transferase
MNEKEQALSSEDFSFSGFFTPLTILKALVFIAIIGLFVFFNSLFNGFVYDDDTQVQNNPLLHSIANIPYFFIGGSFFNHATGQLSSVFYRPMPLALFTLLYPLSGGQAFIFHLFQLLFHISNASMVFLFFNKFFKRSLAFFLATVFLVHPINLETVVYISDMQDILFFFFGIFALLLTTSSISQLRKNIFVPLLLLLSLLSKETGILFIPLILLFVFVLQRKCFTKTFILPIAGVTILYLFVRFFVAHVTPITNGFMPIMQASFPQRFMTMPAIIWYYLQTFFFPAQLAVGYAWVVKQFSFTQFYLPLIFIALFFALLFYFGKTIRDTHKKEFSLFVFFTFWFLLGISMHLQIIPLDATVADRWFYFPIAGLLGLFGILFSLPFFKKISKEILLTIAVIFIIFLSLRTIVRNANWNSTQTLCDHDLSVINDAYNYQSVCGGIYAAEGDFEKAKKHYAISAKLAPNWAFNWYRYGISMQHTGDIKKAKEYYRKSIALNHDVDAYVALAATYLIYDKDPKVAKQIVEDGLKRYPKYQRLQLYLAVCEYEMNNKKKALEIANQANQNAPTPESAYVLNQIMQNQKVVLQ